MVTGKLARRGVYGSYISTDTHLDKADVLGVQLEALTAGVDAVLADQAVVVAAHTAAGTDTQGSQPGEG